MANRFKFDGINLLVLFFWTAYISTTNPAAMEVAAFPLGVADPHNGIGFIGTAKGMEAIRLDNGTTLWHRTQILWPLWKIHKNLIVLSRPSDGNAILVQTLEPSEHAEILDSFPMQVSEFDAQSLIESSQSPQVRIEGNVLYIRWRRTAKYEGGANPPFEVSRPPDERSFATAKVDLGARTSAMIRAWPSNEASCSDDGNLQVFQKDNRKLCSPWRVEGHEAKLVKRKGSLALVVTNQAGKAQRTVVLSPASNEEPLVTEDGLHVIVLDKQPGHTSALIYSTISGRLTGRTGGVPGLSSATIIGSRMFYLSQSPNGLLLNCIAVPAGALLWQRRIISALHAPAATLPR
jgi:hypothetical protein